MTKRISGERSLKTDDAEYTLRLDFQAIAGIENDLDKSIIDVFNFQGSMPKISDLVVIVGHVARIEPEEAYDLINNAGFEAVMKPVVECFQASLQVGDEKKPKARTAKTKA